MRSIKFRAWAKKTYDHYVSDPIEIAYKEFKDSEPRNHSANDWNEWYLEREKRVEEILKSLDPNSDNRYEFTYEMISSFSVQGDGKYIRPCRYELIDVMQYTGLEDSNGVEIYEGDIVFVTGNDGCSDIVDTGVGEIEFFEGLWYICGSIQNGLYDINKSLQIEVIGNVHENPELIRR